MSRPFAVTRNPYAREWVIADNASRIMILLSPPFRSFYWTTEFGGCGARFYALLSLPRLFAISLSVQAPVIRRRPL